MRNPDCQPNCRAVTRDVNHRFCSVHSCWQCGGQAKMQATFYVPRLMTHKIISLCSDGCLAALRDNNETWTLVSKD